ncbi:MAG: prepilin peptidase [Massilia sp.]
MSNQDCLDLVLLVVLVLASAFDLRRRRIPNRLLALALLAALTLHLASGHPAALLSTYLAGFALGLIMFLPLYVMGGMAAGDVKLMATVGAFLGPALVFQASLATYCAGGVLALVMVLHQGRWRTAFANVLVMLQPLLWRRPPTASGAASVGGMPYAVAITAGTLLVMWNYHA